LFRDNLLLRDRRLLVVADDHALLREGLRALLAASEDIEVVGEAADGREAIAAARRLHPDVVLMDVAMPGLGGLEATLEILKDDPRTRVLVLTQYEDREYVRRFLKAGVAGFVLKKAAGSGLADSIRAAVRGGLVLDPDVARHALDDVRKPPAKGDPYDALTDREKQVLKLVAEGRSNKEVAAALGITVKTAMSHREHVMLKLDAHNRTDLVRFAHLQGWLDEI
jgi:DNA-binding NarL/FixJ family response regulator